MLPQGVSSIWPFRPGEVPNTTLPPLQAWLTGVTSLDSPPRMLSTQTRSSRVATLANESMPTKYLKPAMPSLYTARSPIRVAAGSGRLARAQTLGDLLAPAALHPAVGGLGVVDHLADGGIEAEEAVGQAKRLDRVLQGAHAADQVGSAAADHDVERRRPMRAEMLAERVAHGAERGEYIGVVGLAADDEQDIGLLEPVLEADTRHLLHLLVG